MGMHWQAIFILHHQQDVLFETLPAWLGIGPPVECFRVVLSGATSQCRARAEALARDDSRIRLFALGDEPRSHGVVLDSIVRQSFFREATWNLFVDADARLLRPDFVTRELLNVSQSAAWVATCLAWRPINVFQTAPLFALRSDAVEWGSEPSFEPAPHQPTWGRYLAHLSPYEPWPSAVSHQDDTGAAKIKTLVPPYRIYFFPEQMYWDRRLALSGVKRADRDFAILHKDLEPAAVPPLRRLRFAVRAWASGARRRISRFASTP